MKGIDAYFGYLFYAEIFQQNHQDKAILALRDLVYTMDETKPEAYFRLFGMLMRKGKQTGDY